MRSLRPFVRATRPVSVWDLMSQFDEAFKGFESPRSAAVALDKFDFIPVMDVEEKDDRYHFHIDLPGMKKEDMKIDVEDRTLTVSGERKFENREAGHYERIAGKFSRSFVLPESVDADAISAKYENGVLVIDVPKTGKEKRKQISVQ